MTNWTQEELMVYILIWCANADFIESEEEVAFILSKVNEDTYKKMHKEFHQSNDKLSLDKISETFEKLDLSSSDITQVFADVKELFMADGKYSYLEKNLNRGLNKLLTKV